MGVLSKGEYGIPEGIVYSFPVQIRDKKWAVVEGLSISNFAREKMDITAKELQAEMQSAMEQCQD